MHDLTLSILPAVDSPRSVGIYLGSFDPPHRGHVFVVRQLLRRFDAVLVLVAGRHFEKTVRYPLNATYAQRLRMLESAFGTERGRVGIGLAREVLYLRLAALVQERYPRSSVGIGMGDDSYARLMRSKEAFERSGLAWSEREEARLRSLGRKVIVFGRHGCGPAHVTVPEELRCVSSTRVRELVKSGDDAWRALVTEPVAVMVREFGLYGLGTERPTLDQGLRLPP